MEYYPEWMCKKEAEEGLVANFKEKILGSKKSQTALSRRSFFGAGASIFSGSLAVGSLIFPDSAQSSDYSGGFKDELSRPAIPKWPQTDEVRQVWLRRKGTGESVIARYYDGQQVVKENYLACCSVLRDFQSGSVVHMDLELLDLVFSMQKWLVEWGIDRPLLVHSGYRSPATNSREGGAKNSMHMKGRAMDFSIEGIPSDYMGRLASIFSAGGVGFYVGNSGFTHIDTGSVRYWSRKT